MKRKCGVQGCLSDYLAKGLCSKHWSQMNRYGKIPIRTMLSPNDFIIKGEVVEVVLFNSKSQEVGRAIADIKHLDLLKRHKWHLSGSGYAMTRINRSNQLFMHRLIIKAPKSLYVDHINRNKLDNREKNLRTCTQGQNLRNSKIRTDNKSGVSGVSFCERRQKWRARIHFNGKDIHLGYFDSKEEAIEKREKSERKYWKDFLPYEQLNNKS